MATCNGIYDMYQHRKPESEIHQTFREVAPDDKDGMYDNRTPLHLACHFADEEAVRILLERGAEVNEKDGREHTPLATLAVTSLQDRTMKSAELPSRHYCLKTAHGYRDLLPTPRLCSWQSRTGTSKWHRLSSIPAAG